MKRKKNATHKKASRYFKYVTDVSCFSSLSCCFMANYLDPASFFKQTFRIAAITNQTLPGQSRRVDIPSK